MNEPTIVALIMFGAITITIILLYLNPQTKKLKREIAALREKNRRLIQEHQEITQQYTELLNSLD